MSDRTRRAGVLILLPLAAALTAVAGANSLRWLGTTIPGFFLMQNRVVPSVTVPSWDDSVPMLFQQQVVAVDGVPVTSTAEVYRRVQHVAPGTTIRYMLRNRDGILREHVIRTRRFSEGDYLFVFGAFLLTGIAFIAAGLVVYFLRPHNAASLGLLSAGVVGGVFAVTAADLYGPGWFFRLHVCAEALVPAALLHLALVFPTERLRGKRTPVLNAAYLGCGVLALVYEAVLNSPAAYTAVHLTATTAQGAAGAVLIVIVAYDLLTTSSPHVRRQILFAALGVFAAFVIPSALMTASGLLGGRVPVNASALCGFLFPLSLGYAVTKRDLFAIDVFLRRAATVMLAIVCSAHLTHGLGPPRPHEHLAPVARLSAPRCLPASPPMPTARTG